MSGQKLSAEALLEIVTQFVAQRVDSPGPVGLDTKLRGLIDSFGLIDLGMEISKTIDVPLMDGNLLPEDFETPRVLWTRIQEVCDAEG